MSSIIEGYFYDIFISYRQKDNKHDRWVTEFVDNLKGELEATFKEEISVYFDINPHDGLLETHDVDESLKDKLKCLVFIPIISRTYCDPKSFAWEHEFKAFVEQASQDQIGLKVKLPNGNVANRVLPVRIHDLDGEDIKLCESVLGSVLRGIEFIYKEPGVNKPLTSDDDEKKNLNNTKYRIQINKVANAIREIITALGQHIPQKEEVPKEVFKPVSVPRKNNKTKILTGSVVLMALIIIGYFLIQIFSKPKEQLEKSVAVLPFRNDSPNDTNTYFINGIMEKVLNNLQMIKELRVISRTSVEQYRNSTKSIPKIAKEQGVNFIVEGSGQKYGNTFSLSVQLIKAAKENHLWGKSYEQEIKETKDIFRVQSQIAQAIAAEMKATITPDEKQLIEKVPTTNLTAYDYYQIGREAEGKFSYYDLTASSTTFNLIYPSTKQSLEKAEKMYNKALEYDSTFAPAYAGLAGINWSKKYYREYFSENFMDSVLFLANKALSFDDQLPDAYYIRGMYYSNKENIKQALTEFDKTLKFNPNYWLAYYGKGTLYLLTDDYVMAIDNYQKAASRYHGSELSDILESICATFLFSGFKELANKYNVEALKLEPDSVRYFFWLSLLGGMESNTQKSLEFLGKGYSIDSTDLVTLEYLADSYLLAGQSKESLKFIKKYLERLNRQGITRVNNLHRVGYIYWQNGLKDSAKYYFNKQIEYCNNAIKLGRNYGIYLAYYDLAGVYAFMGNKIKAYENLKIYNKKQKTAFWEVVNVKTDPLFNSIRNEPEFQQIVRDVEAKYKAEHERVRKWLEENKML